MIVLLNKITLCETGAKSDVNSARGDVGHRVNLGAAAERTFDTAHTENCFVQSVGVERVRPVSLQRVFPVLIVRC